MSSERTMLPMIGNIAKIFGLGIVVGVVVVAACGDSGTAPSPGGSIVGDVTMEGRGLKGVMVSLSNGTTATTTEDGSFRFDGIASGTYEVSVSGYPAEAVFSTTEKPVTIGPEGGLAEVAFGARNSDRDALVALYNATDGPHWTNNANWLTSAPLGDWHGVTTNAAGRVTTLWLMENNLRGTIPPEVGGLTTLQVLALFREPGLVGVIPSELGNLADLTLLALGGNDLSGTIPSEFGNLTDLTGLYLWGNRLTGTIPPEIGNLSRLQGLQLDGRSSASAATFADAGPGAQGSRSAGSLAQNVAAPNHSLGLEDGQQSAGVAASRGNVGLTGQIPAEFQNLTNLTLLTLGHNRLTGGIPSWIGNLTMLEEFAVHNNQLTGGIPQEIANLGNLELFWAPNNNLSGSIPPVIGNLDRLTRLGLHDNSLTGDIPPAIGDLTSLVQLTLSRNALVGTIPGDLGDLSNLEVLYLNQNRLTGGVPSELGDLNSLVSLSLRDNELTGTLPDEIGDLSNLVRLWVYGNPLSGPLPLTMTRLANLSLFNFSDTRLCVPDDPAFVSWLQSVADVTGSGVDCGALGGDRDALVALYNATDGPNWTNATNWLTGAPLSDWYGVTTDASDRVVQLDLEDNNLVGPIPAELGDLAKLEILVLVDSLTGPIPRELGNLASLEQLTIVSPGLTGTIPPELGNSASLEILGLAGPGLTGPIPSELGRLASLEYLFLGSTGLTGPIPPELGSLSKLTQLALVENDLLGGPIPSELGNLADLTVLALNGNALTGPLPPELGSLAQLEGLLLHDNPELSGRFPETLTQLDRLETLTSHGTQLCIPSEPVFQAWLQSLQESSGRLCIVRIAVLPSSNDQQATVGKALPEPVVVQALGAHDVPVENAMVAFTPLAGNGTTDPDVVTTGEGGIAQTVWTLGPAAGAQTLIATGSEGRSAQVTATATTPGADVAAIEIVWGNGQSGDAGAELHQRVIVRAVDSTGAPVEGATVAFQPGEGHGTANPSEAVTRASGWAVTAWTLGLGDIEQTLTATTGDVPVRFQATALYSERTALEAFYHATGGSDWANRQHWLTDAPLDQWFGVSTDQAGRVVSLVLADKGLKGHIPPAVSTLRSLRQLLLDQNDLAGSLPPELGRLRSLEVLGLNNNRLSGGIPPELGDLSSLRRLRLGSNELVGQIPVELTNLSDLRALVLFDNRLKGRVPGRIGLMDELTLLNLADNQLDGSVPASMGELAELEALILSHNDLSGPIPAELGQLQSLRQLSLGNNNFSGALPSELSNLVQLRILELQNNLDLAGTPSTFLVSLSRLERLRADGTGICFPPLQTLSSIVRRWLEGISDLQLRLCGEGQALAYLTQAIQNPSRPVPLVAGEEALLRVFMTTVAAGTRETIPPVRARFYVNGQRLHETWIPGGSSTLQANIREDGDLRRTANATIPGHVIQPGLEMAVEIDPDGTLDPMLGVPKRFPVKGLATVDVRDVHPTPLIIVPLVHKPLVGGDWDRRTVGIVDEITPGHSLLRDINYLLPVGRLHIFKTTPLRVITRNSNLVLTALGIAKALSFTPGYWMGLLWDIDKGGLAAPWINAAVSKPIRAHMTHELGHLFGLNHAPCGNPDNIDPYYPRTDGRIGDWGYVAASTGAGLVRPNLYDLMSYCTPSWISAYSFTKAMRHLEAAPSPSQAPVRTATLLVSGGLGADGRPYLNPAFAVDAPPALPDGRGAYRLEARRANGDELFSTAFDMPAIADGDGESVFVFALPVQDGWESELASLVLSGPGGTVEMREGSELPMTIVRDSGTGELRAFLHGVPDLPLDPAAWSVDLQSMVGGGADAGTPPLDVTVSRGLPGAGDWRR